MGMDTPELPWAEVLAAKSSAEKDGKAYICPGVCACAYAHLREKWVLRGEDCAGGGGCVRCDSSLYIAGPQSRARFVEKWEINH